MRYLSTFSGIGGLDLGFDRAGMTCVGQVEIDKHARRVLEHHWPDVPKHDDITTAKEWASGIGLVGRVDIVCGGAPCQDLSVAGKRAGLAGDRSRLVLDMVALAAHVEADWIVYENVPGLLNSNKGRDFGYLLAYMADAGFPVIEWRVLDSRYWGVPQRRRRVFVVASTADRGRGPLLLEPESGAGDSHQVAATGAPAAGHPASGAVLGGWSAGGVTTAIASKWSKGSSGPAGDEHHNLVVVRQHWAGSASESDIAAPLGALTGGPRTTDIETATWVVES